MDELKNIAPNLSKIKKDSPFRVPEDYFDNFAARLENKIQQENKPEHRSKLFLLRKPHLAIAATFAGLIIMAVTVLRVVETKHTSAGLTNEEIMAYIQDDIYDYDEYTIIENLKPEKSINVKSELNDDEIIKYLENDGIDVSTISDEF